VNKIVADETSPLARARKIFHWIDANVRYCAEEEYCLIPGFSTKALTTRQGGCGIQSLLYRWRLAIARAAGCDLAVVTTQPGSKSQANAIRQGFSLLYTRAVLIKPIQD
jgi:hypothetical protein